ncbi:MAG: hypothetical protein HY898_08880 [Deltaproteobacteria bacterium]|nr:hypothetical protein [Deltaproteobacteria bacterium]
MRSEFERRAVSRDLLARLYMAYCPIPDIDGFVERAGQLFPRLNCGLCSVYLAHVLGAGTAARGRYGGVNHTFLSLGGDGIVDITADQFGGPRVYVGPLRQPWWRGRARP